MRASEWVEAVVAAAAEIAAEADRQEPPRATAEALGRLLVLLGRAAGHADRLGLEGPVGARGRRHFAAEARQAGATALALLRQGRPERSSREIADDVARRLVLPGGEVRDEPAPAGHGAAGVGGAVVAIGRALPAIALDDRDPSQLDGVLERVLGHAIAAAART
jgi:hypothetical protein